MIKIGDQIKDASIDVYHEENLKKINLSDYKGKWFVLLFYPADFTFVCPTELEDAANHYDQFRKLDCEIISISTDTAFVHKAWHDNSMAIKKVQYPMGADPTGNLCKEFGTYIDAEGLSQRATFIIDPDGKVIAYEIHDNSIGRSIEEILRKLEAAKFVRDNGGAIVCPASWHPGDKTLKPGIDLVGKI